MVYLLKTTISLSLIFPFILSLLLMQTGQQARLYFGNIPLQDEKLLVVTVSLADIADLYGAEMQLHYDPTQLRVRDSNPRLDGVQIAPGPLLAYDNRFVVKNIVETEAGLIDFAITLLNPAPAISGKGVLATIPFEVIGNGPFAINIITAKIASSNSKALPLTTEDFYLDSISTEPTTAAWSMNAPSWQWWGMVSVVVGLLIVLAALVLTGSKRITSTISANAYPYSHEIPGIIHSSARTATVLTEQGNCVLKQGNLQKAYELFNRAIEHDPTNAVAWLGKGLVAHHIAEKRICFQRVLALDPNNSLARTELYQLEENQ